VVNQGDDSKQVSTRCWEWCMSIRHNWQRIRFTFANRIFIKKRQRSVNKGESRLCHDDSYFKDICSKIVKLIWKYWFLRGLFKMKGVRKFILYCCFCWSKARKMAYVDNAFLLPTTLRPVHRLQSLQNGPSLLSITVTGCLQSMRVHKIGPTAVLLIVGVIGGASVRGRWTWLRGTCLKRYRQGNECARMNLNNQQDDTWSPNEVSQLLTKEK